MSADPLSFLDQGSSDPLSFLESSKKSSADQLSFLDTTKKESPDYLANIGKAFSMPTGSFAITPQAAKKAAVNVGTQAAVGGAFAPIKALASLSPYAPRALNFLAGLAQSATTGAAVPAVEALSEGHELPTSEELLKEGAIWAGIDLALHTAGLATSFGAAVNKIAKETGLPRHKVVSQVYQGAKKYYGWGKPKIDPETGTVTVLDPEEAKALVDQAKKLEKEIVIEPKVSPSVPEKKTEGVVEPKKKPTKIRDFENIDDVKAMIAESESKIKELETKKHRNAEDNNLIKVLKTTLPGLREVLKELETTGKVSYLEPEKPAVKEPEAKPPEEREKQRLPNSAQEFVNKEWPDIHSSIAEQDDKVILITLMVPEENRGQGIGSDVISHLIDYADAKNKSIFVHPTKETRGLYKKFGFIETPESLKPFGSMYIPKKPHDKKPKLTPQQIQNRKVAEAERKKIETRNAKELQERKSQAEKERVVAFRAMGIGKAREAAPEVKEEVIPNNPDSTELEEDLELELSPNDEVRTQAFAEAQLMKDKIVGKLNGIWAKFDVEAPFKAVNAPRTGKAVKLFYDTKNTYLEEAKGLVKKLKSLKLSKEDLWDAFLAAETDKDLISPEMNQARDMFRDYFDKSFDKLKEEGILSLPWPKSAIARLEQQITDLKTKLTAPNIKKQMQGRVNKEIEEIRKTIAILNNLKYVPKSASLISKALAEVLPDIQPKTLRQFAIAAHKKRTTGALADWVADRPEIKDVLHPYDFIGYYADRKGNDIALLRIANAAIEENLASKGERLGFKMRPGEFPALEGYYLHPAMYEYLKNLTNPLPFNIYDKISRWAKASIVFDPTYLGTLIPYFRTLLQNPAKLAKLPKYWKKALNDMLNKTPAYLEFLENGGASNPYPETRDFQSWLDVEKLKNGSPEQLLFQQFLTKEGAKDLFNRLADFSWMVDRLARLAYYNLLVDKGFSPSDSAKLAAENFVDYNKLPAKTRRWMGRIFFAPATQVLSIINDVVLASAPVTLAKSFFKGDGSFKNDDINKERVRLLAGTILVLAAISQLMKQWGFKEEEVGTRYVAEYEDENGKKKEVVLTPTHPLNYSFRWVNTFWRGFGPGETSPSQKLWGRLAGQLGPVPKMIQELGENENRDGKRIWDPVGDSLPVALYKISKYLLGKIEPFGLEKFHTVEDRKIAREAIKNRMGWAEWFMESIEFFYSRKTKRERTVSKIRYLKSQMKRLAKTGELTEDARVRYENAIESLTSDTDDEK